MKTFLLSLISAVTLAQSNIDLIDSTDKSSVSMEKTIPQAGSKIGQTVNWHTEYIIEKASEMKLAKKEVANSLVFGFETGQAAGTLQADQYVLSYAEFPDHGAEGNYSAFTCTV